MKTSTLPSIESNPSCAAAETVLMPGETLSSLMEEALRQSIAQRQTQQAFLERGLESAAQAKLTNHYLSAEEVLQTLEQRLRRANSSNRDAS
jgi:predicted transcriptional regulator